MKVLYILPNQSPLPLDIEDDLEIMQTLLYTDIFECVDCFEDNVVLLCDDNGWANNQMINRCINNTYIVGPILLVGTYDDQFCSLNVKQINIYTKVFEHFHIKL